MTTDKRFIEESFPVKEVSKESAREKNIRHGHISTLHIWWARRPLAASRATAYAALTPAPNTIEEWQKKRDFIIDLCKWENSDSQQLLEKARQDILAANGGKPPRVLDPFAGGGAIPLEALRLGCETYASDYNPVATLILKCTLEYPQKYGKPVKRKVKRQVFGEWVEEEVEVNPLLEDVKKWGNWILDEVKKELGQFYPPDEGDSIPVGYIWAHTIPCQNPNCGAEIPLMRQFWLAKKSNKKVAVYPFVEKQEVKFKIVGDEYEAIPTNFDPEYGTISQAIATCPVCGITTDAKTTRKLFLEKKSGQKIIVVVTLKSHKGGKQYRIGVDQDLEVFKQAEIKLQVEREKLTAEWGIDPVPDESLPYWELDGKMIYGFGFRLMPYGFKKWGDFFNSRQKLALITFTKKIRETQKLMIEEGYSEDYSTAIANFLAIGINRVCDYNSVLCLWLHTLEAVAGTFAQGVSLPMRIDYVEINPTSQSFGSWSGALNWINKIIEHCSQSSNLNAGVSQSSATSLPYDDNYFDAVLTDPPYYDNVPYSYLSDFFYVWLKRTSSELNPDLFVTPLTSKKAEIIAELPMIRGMGKNKIQNFIKDIKSAKDFEILLGNAFNEISRVLKPNGLAIIVYAHKSTEGWETLINSLLSSGLVITGAWPLNTERQTRIRAKESAALASSIYIVARKIERKPTGFYNDVKHQLEEYLSQKLERLWQEGIGGADFFIAAIGSAIEVFGKYEKVLDYEGNVVRANRLLEDVRKIATDFAVRQILHNGFAGEISDLTRFYVLFRWEYGAARVHFDDARKLAASCALDLSHEWNRRGFIRKEKEFIRVSGPQERKAEDLKNPSELIDVLHRVLLFWEKSRREEMLQLLRDSGFGQTEAFYRVAQAISETLPNDNKEKKLLDGFLSGRERLKEAVKKESVQTSLFDEQ